MNIKVSIWFLITAVLILTSGQDPDIPDNWYSWKHKTVYSSELYCRDYCESEHTQITLKNPFKCCFFTAVPHWTFKSNQIGPLSIEYTRRNGVAMIMDENEMKFDFYHVSHQNGFLSRFPPNICNFTLLVTITFSRNRIIELPDLSCLSNLDELNLHRNHIVYIQNTTFSKNRKLRTIDLSRNHIQYIEPKSLLIQPGSLMIVDLSWNYLESIDITIIVLEKHFATINYSHNKLSRVTNEMDWRCCKQTPVHGGFVDFSHNKFKRFFNLSDLGFSESLPADALVKFYGFDIRHNQWLCDCLFQPFLEKALNFYDYYESIHAQYDGKCVSPPDLTSFSIPDFRKNDSYDLLICNLSMVEKCPRECYCYYQPSQNRTVVKCMRSPTSEKLPNWSIMPDYDNIEMDLSNNSIDVLKRFDYFGRITKFNLSNNSLNGLNFSMFNADKLTDLFLLDNPITVIDKSVQDLQTCAVKLGHINIKCDCESIWIQPWLLKQHNCEFQNTIICQTEDSQTNAINADRDILCPVKKSITWLYVLFGAVIACIFAMLFIVWTKYRYEVYLLYRKMSSPKRNKINIVMNYDAYISFDGENVELRLWTAKILLRYLESKGYKIFYPLRDCNLGQPREENILRKINKCATFIVFLSHSYFKSRHLKLEWKYIWHSYKANHIREIIIINYDDLCFEDTEDDRINAFLRLGYSLEFFNISKTLLTDIENRIRRRPKQTATGLENRLVKFIQPRKGDNEKIFK